MLVGSLKYVALDPVGYENVCCFVYLSLLSVRYVPDQTLLHLRGATFLFDGNAQILYRHYDTGVLAYSETMRRPLSFLEPYIGKKALNPLALEDLAGMNNY